MPRTINLSFPILLDPLQCLARQVGATRVPTAAILSSTGKVLYRGRIDDRFISFGKKRLEPTQRDTQDALDRILAGKEPAQAETEVIGCLLPSSTIQRDGSPIDDGIFNMQLYTIPQSPNHDSIADCSHSCRISGNTC